ncbi:MAG: Fic family protein [Ramlibacter sp.]|nr:Fic family protein [Ramlibacter sp.]
MFDPFGDYATAGYLRNVAAEKDLQLVKIAEHQLFRAQLAEAFAYLQKRKPISYRDFLKVHEILFGGLYPWAGKDRAQLLPDRAVAKGEVFLAHPQDCKRAVDEALSQVQGKGQIANRPGFVMGLFAYGHPCLDGNGRTMLVVHAELCFRAGISIDWTQTSKDSYLQALTREIESPNDGHLDVYLKPFIRDKVPRDAWIATIGDLSGLDGSNAGEEVAVSYADPAVAQHYREFERRRNYKLSDT